MKLTQRGLRMGSLIVLAFVAVYFLIEWVTSFHNRQKYYESTIYGIGVGITIVLIFLFSEIYILLLTESEGWRFWERLLPAVMIIIQLFSNIKNFLTSKKQERLFTTTINHLIHTHRKEFFTIQDLKEATKIQYEDDLVKLFNLAQKSGHIPANIILDL